MNTIKLDVHADEFHFSLELTRRLTVVKGNSASGKTTLTEFVSAEDRIAVIESDYPVLVATNSTWQSTVAGSTDSIIIFDDLRLVGSPEFAKAYKDYCVLNNLWFLVMGREDNEEQLQNFYHLSYCMNNIFEMVHEGTTYTLKKYYKFPALEREPDIILTEDSKAGFVFFKKLFRETEVISAESGKGALIPQVDVLIRKGYDNILAVVDSASFGCHAEELYSRFCRREPSKVMLMSDYECFEEMLLQTNLLNCIDLVREEMSDLVKYANQYYSWETYFEKMIDEVTKGKPYHHAHQMRLKNCYLTDCDLCPAPKRATCDHVLFGSKFVELLKGTKYERLLKYSGMEQSSPATMQMNSYTTS